MTKSSSFLFVICIIINLTLLLSFVPSSMQSVSTHHTNEIRQCKELNQWNCYSSRNEGYFCNSKDDMKTEIRWYYDKGSCHKFNYKGCNGNRNRFCTKETCMKRCEGE